VNCWTAEALVRLARVANDERLVAARAQLPREGKSGSPAALGGRRSRSLWRGAEALVRLAPVANDERQAAVRAQLPTERKSESLAALGGRRSRSRWRGAEAINRLARQSTRNRRAEATRHLIRSAKRDCREEVMPFSSRVSRRNRQPVLTATNRGLRLSQRVRRMPRLLIERIIGGQHAGK
jgi:hypothetical protein